MGIIEGKKEDSSKHSQLIQIATNKSCLKYSFILRTVIDWNSIPLHIKEIEDKDKFKAAVAQYFNQ